MAKMRFRVEEITLHIVTQVNGYRESDDWNWEELILYPGEEVWVKDYAYLGEEEKEMLE